VSFTVIHGLSGQHRSQFATFDEALKFFAANQGQQLFHTDKADLADDGWDDGLTGEQREAVELSQ
jgi:hypothetical protein